MTGSRPIDEPEVLQLLDIALRCSMTASGSPLTSHGHILTGIELEGQERIGQDSYTAHDPRGAIARRLLRQQCGSASHTKNTRATTDTFEEVREMARKKLSTLPGRVEELVSGKVANLILSEQKNLDLDAGLSTFGMDSMLAAEFRSFAHQAFQVEVPFLELLADKTTTRGLARSLTEALLARSAASSPEDA